MEAALRASRWGSCESGVVAAGGGASEGGARPDLS